MTFLDYAYLALAEHFTSRESFEDYVGNIRTDQLRALFLRTASFYLFLVKNGDWHVNIPDSNPVVDYLTNTYKYLAIFSLIESLSQSGFIDFYEYLESTNYGVQFPIQDKKALSEHYSRYKERFGSIQRCTAFFQALSPATQCDLISKLEVRDKKPTMEDFAKCLYEIRSKFVHEAKLVLFLNEGTSIGPWSSKTIVSALSMKDVMRFFEEGLITHFQSPRRNNSPKKAL